MIAVQCCVGFCRTTTWTSHNYNYIYTYVYVCVCVYIYISPLPLKPLSHPLPQHFLRLWVESTNPSIGSTCDLVTSCCLVTQSCPTLWPRQAPLSMEFSRQEYWSGLPFSSPGDLPNPGIEPESPALAGRFFTTELPRKSIEIMNIFKSYCYYGCWTYLEVLNNTCGGACLTTTWKLWQLLDLVIPMYELIMKFLMSQILS